MDQRPGDPGPTLKGVVRALWYLRMERVHETEQILPLPSVEVIVNLGEPYRLLDSEGAGAAAPVGAVFTTGLRRGPVRIGNPPLIEHVAIQLPVDGPARFGLAPGPGVAAVTGRLGDALAEVRSSGGTPEELLTRTVVALEQCLLPESPAQRRVRAALELLTAEPTRPVGTVAAEVGVSHQRLIADFHRYVGRPPKWVAQLLLVHRLLDRVPGTGPVPTWTELVADSPYADQSHFHQVVHPDDRAEPPAPSSRPGPARPTATPGSSGAEDRG